MARTATRSPQLTDLAVVFAHGFLRLTRTAQNLGISGAREPQNPLDVLAQQSPPVSREAS